MIRDAAARNRLDDALSSVLTRDRHAVVAALGGDGFRVPLPASFDLGDHQALAVPQDRATMLDVVVPADRLALVGLWEQARESGTGSCSVHTLSDPDRSLTITVFDVRHQFGVWLAVLSEEDQTAGLASGLLAESLMVPFRPRQATSRKSMTAIITGIDENVTRMLGWTAEQMVGVRSSEFIHPDDQGRAIASWMQLLSNRGSQRIRLRHRCEDGTWRWLEIEQVHNGAEDPDQIEVTSYISDISEEMAAHEALRRREQLFSRLAESLPTGVLQLQQDRTIVFANARLAKILGLTGTLVAADVLDTVVPEDRGGAESALRAALDRGEDQELELEIIRPGSLDRRKCAVTLAAVSDQEGRPGALICVSDVTEPARLREELKARATFDALTGCLNRAAVMQALQDFLDRPGGQDTAVVFVDIDKFKPVNDRFGHAAGDELLIHVATLLRALTRGEDVVGRIGGDEFLLICRGPGLLAREPEIAARIRDALNDTAILSTGSIDVGVSIGVAYAEPGMTSDDIVARADTAMYQSKRHRAASSVLNG